MESEKKMLLKTSLELSKEAGKQASYYKLKLGTDPETSVVVTDTNLDVILSDLPEILSTVINSQLLIETVKLSKEGSYENPGIRNQQGSG